MANTFNAPPLQIPDGRYACLEDMEAFGQTLQTLVREQEAELAPNSYTARHNQIVDYLNVLAASCNEQLAIFK
jgi:hypothetical protein